MEQTLSERIVAEARTWITRPFGGTSYRHQGRLKGTAIDCAGFIVGVAINAQTGIDFQKPDHVLELGKELNVPHNYKRRENGKELLKLLKDYMDQISFADAAPGDVIALIDQSLREPTVPRHLAIITEILPQTWYIIHAANAGVVEHRIDDNFRKRFHSLYRVRPINAR